MMGLTISALLMSQVPLVEFMDSELSSNTTYVIINGRCAVPVLKVDLKDKQDEVVEKVLKVCNEE